MEGEDGYLHANERGKAQIRLPSSQKEPTLQIPSFQKGETISSCCLSHPLCDTLLRQLWQTNTPVPEPLVVWGRASAHPATVERGLAEVPAGKTVTAKAWRQNVQGGQQGDVLSIQHQGGQAAGFSRGLGCNMNSLFVPETVSSSLQALQRLASLRWDPGFSLNIFTAGVLPPCHLVSLCPPHAHSSPSATFCSVFL